MLILYIFIYKIASEILNFEQTSKCKFVYISKKKTSAIFNKRKSHVTTDKYKSYFVYISFFPLNSQAQVTIPRLTSYH